jgi:hypothetical protein
MLVRILSALSVAAFAVACTAPAEEPEVGSAQAQDLTAGSLTVACKTLGQFDSCGRVSFCQSKTEASCVAKGAVASDPEWIRMCPLAGHNEQACGWQASFCSWQAQTQCVPTSGVAAPDSESGGDPIAVTCKTLGEVGQCGATTLCQTKTEAMCKAKGAVANDPEWIRMCPLAGHNEQACGWQSSFCSWQSVSQCVRR